MPLKDAMNTLGRFIREYPRLAPWRQAAVVVGLDAAAIPVLYALDCPNLASLVYGLSILILLPVILFALVIAPIVHYRRWSRERARAGEAIRRARERGEELSADNLRKGVFRYTPPVLEHGLDKRVRTGPQVK